MAVYHFQASMVQFSKGQSAVAKAAYNARTQLVNERDRRMTHDYSRSHSEIAFEGIFAPANAPAWARDREQLWNHAEAAENRVDSACARNIILALPHELTDEQRKRLMTDFVREEFMRKGMVADVAIHRPDPGGDDRNHHAHIMLTVREIGPDGFKATKDGLSRDVWDKTATLDGWKDRFAELGAKALAKEGFVIEAGRFRHGHQKFEQQRNAALDRGDFDYVTQLEEREATKHLGPKATALERDGIATDLGDQNREATKRNNERAELHKQRDQITAEIIDLAAERMLRREKAETIGQTFDRAASDLTTGPTREAPKPERELTPTAADIRLAYATTDGPQQFAEALQERGIRLAEVSEADALASALASFEAKEAGKYAATYRPGEIVAVNRFGHVYGLTQQTTGESRAEVAGYLAGLDRGDLMGLSATRNLARAESRAAFIEERQEARELSETASQIRLAYVLSGTAQDFAEGLQERGLTLAVVSPEDAAAFQRIAAFAKEIDHHAPTYSAGDLVAVNAYGSVYGLTRHTTGDNEAELSKYLATIDRDTLDSVDTRETIREANRAAFVENLQRGREMSAIESELSNLVYEAENGQVFVFETETSGIYFARATKDDLTKLQAEYASSFATADRPDISRSVYGMEEGEIIAVTMGGHLHRLNPTKVDPALLEALLIDGGQEQLDSVSEVRADLMTASSERDALWYRDRAEAQERRDERASETNAAEGYSAAADRLEDSLAGMSKGAVLVFNMISGAVEKLADFVASIFDGGDTGPAPSRSQVEAYRAQRAHTEAMRNIADALNLDQPIKSSDLANLSRSTLQGIKNKGDSYIRDLADEYSQQQERDRGRGLER